MTVDVETEIVIERPREEVAAFASDPDNAASWREGIKSVTWETPGRLRIGSRFALVTSVLGSRVGHAYEVLEHEPGARFVMCTEDGPFPLETTYAFEDAGDGSTRMLLRNQGEPKRFSKPSARLIAAAMRRANAKELKRLKELLERREA